MKRRQAIAIALLGCLALALAWFDSYSSQIAAPPRPDETAEKTSKKSSEDSYLYGLWKWTTHDAITVYTFFLAVFTGVVGCTAIVQIRYLRRADETARIMAETAQAQTAKMGEWADAAEKQMLLTGQQADVQRKQHAIGRLQFLVANRPRLRVRHVSLVDRGAQLGLPSFFFDHGGKVDGGLVVVNVGGTKAKIIESRYRIFFSRDGLPVGAPYDTFYHQLLLPEQELAVGESCATPISDTINMPDPDAQEGTTKLRRFEYEKWTVFVMGQIKYEDEGEAVRFMGFCRERHKDGRFRAVDDPDYEYED